MSFLNGVCCCAFFLAFGWVGVAALKNGASVILSSAIATGFGLASMVAIPPYRLASSRPAHLTPGQRVRVTGVNGSASFVVEEA